VVRVPEGRFVIEQAPIRPGDGAEHGVVAEGAVGTRAAGRFRLFRYEVRRWRDGIIPDVAEAVESPHRLSENPDHTRRLLELVPQVPTPVWGRDELGCEPTKLTDRLDAPDTTPINWRRPARRRPCFRCAAD
jgi:hypothetical protein